jgi:hypothetical protein
MKYLIEWAAAFVVTGAAIGFALGSLITSVSWNFDARAHGCAIYTDTGEFAWNDEVTTGTMKRKEE